MSFARVENWKALALVGLSLFTPTIAPLKAQAGAKEPVAKQTPRIEGFKSLEALDIDGKPVSLGSFDGKALLVVNTASECGYTPQYKGLEELYKKYKDRDFVVLGFPSNDFGAQEPGSNAEIKKFCALRFKTSFPMFSKVTVKGPGKHPVYKYLSETQANAATRKEPEWNFAKYLINPAGEVVGFYPSKVEPMSPDLAKDIEKVLPKKS